MHANYSKNNPCLSIADNEELLWLNTLIIKQLDMRSQIAHITTLFFDDFFFDMSTISRSPMTDLINSCFYHKMVLK